MLTIFNSLTGRKEEFRPLLPGQVRMYVCGMTVYDYCHVGHARSQIAFDVVRRWLQASGFAVTYVRNITDIDDKIIQRAREQGEDYRVLTERYIRAADEDFAALGILPPDHEPRATAYMPQMIAMIGQLVERGYAYVAGSGDVLYSVARFAGYGRLSGKKLADLRAGARVEVDAHKHDPLDFVLWKSAKPGEPAWESPWGPGRPGWHIECSAMSVALLGGHFDIHGGGADLRFPHHENEIAQTCAACGTPFVNLWMHNGFVRINDEKMSKSLGNFFTVREVLPRLRPEVLRAFLLASHYRGPINYSEENLRQADAALQRLYLALRGVAPAAAPVPGAATAAFRAAMDDDFNTPEALAALQSAARALNVARAGSDLAQAGELAAELRGLGAVLGLLQHDPERWLATRSELMTAPGARPQRLEVAAIEARIAARSAARQARNWAESDRLRDELAAQDVVLEDGPAGTSWRWR
ncbi:MAG: cysteine--tRNA ligase [Gammaproteobacteria bacterium]|nr:cysteine--tRNA ligase [Gammaproteobacteria bacterium]